MLRYKPTVLFAICKLAKQADREVLIKKNGLYLPIPKSVKGLIVLWGLAEIRLLFAVGFISEPDVAGAKKGSRRLNVRGRGIPREGQLWTRMKGFNMLRLPARISNYTHHKVWNEITHPFPNFNGGNG